MQANCSSPAFWTRAAKIYHRYCPPSSSSANPVADEGSLKRGKSRPAYDEAWAKFGAISRQNILTIRTKFPGRLQSQLSGSYDISLRDLKVLQDLSAGVARPIHCRAPTPRAGLWGGTKAVGEQRCRRRADRVPLTVWANLFFCQCRRSSCHESNCGSPVQLPDCFNCQKVHISIGEPATIGASRAF